MKSDKIRRLDPASLTLYAVTDSRFVKNSTLESDVMKAIEGGVTFVQYRDKDKCHEDFVAEAKKIQRVCKISGIPFVINDDVQAAFELKADGVHIGQNDMPLSKARCILGNDAIIGLSVQTVEQAERAEKDGADYIGVGAVFATSTKDDAADVSVTVLHEICNRVSIPVVAIGGIREDNMDVLSCTGIAGVAIVSAIFASDDIRKTCMNLKKKSLEIVDSGNEFRDGGCIA